MKQNMNYLVDGVSRMHSELVKLGVNPSRLTMEMIERRIIANTLSSGRNPREKDELDQTCKAMLSAAGGSLGLYHHIKNQHAELLVDRAMSDMRRYETDVRTAMQEEFETNLHTLRSTSRFAESAISKISGTIEELRELSSGLNGRLASVSKKIEREITNNDVFNYADTVRAAKKTLTI